MEGVEHKCYEEQLRELQLYSLRKTRLKRDRIALNVKGGCCMVGVRLFCTITSDRARYWPQVAPEEVQVRNGSSDIWNKLFLAVTVRY